MNKEEIETQTKEIVTEVIEKGKLKQGDIFVVGCSSSEILGHNIGTYSSLDAAEIVFGTLYPLLNSRGIYLAAQCCEHLNRALVVEEECLVKYDLEQVNAIPQVDHAGGAFATCTYNHLQNQVLVEDVKARAKAGIDIGGTLIGMHIHPVVVPVTLNQKYIGEAHVIAARSRPKYVGGQRAIYDERLL